MSNQPTSTDFALLLDDLDAGVFKEKIGRALSDAAAGVVATGKKGKVTITLDLAQIADSRQVDVSHKIAHVAPTAKGKFSEENTTKTPLYVGKGGKLSLFPESQHRFEFNNGEFDTQGSTQGA